MILASVLSTRNCPDAVRRPDQGILMQQRRLSRPPLPIIPSSARALSGFGALARERRESEATETQG